jgi:hypothetical protein
MVRVAETEQDQATIPEPVFLAVEVVGSESLIGNSDLL